MLRTFLSSLLFEDIDLESSSSGIFLTQQQADKFSDVMASIGLDASGMLGGSGEPVGLGEALFADEDIPEEPVVATGDKLKAKAPKIELKIDESTLWLASEFYLKGVEMGAGNWYFDAHEILKNSFGGNEQDLVLFTIILAATSVQNEVYTNFVEAANIYQAIKFDIVNNRELLKVWATSVGTGKSKFRFKEPEPTEGEVLDQDLGDEDEKDAQVELTDQERQWQSLQIYTNTGAIKMMSTGAKFGNISRAVTMYLDNQLTIDIARTAIVNSLVPRKLTKKQMLLLSPEEWFTPTNQFIGKFKIANFALTLLDPEFSNSDQNAFNVVVDTWMFRVAFPDQLKQGMDGDMSKIILGKLFSSKKHYNLVAHMISDLAKKAEVSPHVMQAAIWTGIKRKWEGASASETNYVATIKNLIDNYGENIEGIKDEINQLAGILKSMTTEVAATAIKDRRTKNILAIVDRNRPIMAAAKAERDANKAAGIASSPKVKGWVNYPKKNPNQTEFNL